MRKRTAFRPWLAECLESRAVPAVAVLAPAVAPPIDISTSLPPQVHADDPRVLAAIDTFDQAYATAVESILLAPGPDGKVNLSANRAAFNASIQDALDVLVSDLVATLDPASSSSTTTTQVTDAILGDDPNSLVSRLLALPTQAISPASTVSLALIPLIHSTPVPLTTHVDGVAGSGVPVTRIPIPQGIAPAPTEILGSATRTSTDVSQEVRKAFGTFLEDYFHAVKGVLLSNQANPQAARDDFDARVDRALQGLGDSLTGSLGRYPAASTLIPQIRQAIASDAPTSLKSQLKGLPTPGGTQAALVRDFTMGSARAVAEALSVIAGDVSEIFGSR
ncbi:hypothetical protein P12x_005691 [Tundrisphaera lichenicola]|uniref:hypothetical protein n=1 Tax=Tundrisphaera lichenicola TaxID=2029860 RepID=UPI003EB74FC2